MIQLASDVTQEFVDAGLKAITDLQTVGGYNTLFFGNNGLNPIIGNTHSARFLFLWLCEVEGITHFERMIPIIAVSPMYYENGYETFVEFARRKPDEYAPLRDASIPQLRTVSSSIMFANPFIPDFFARRRGYFDDRVVAETSEKFQAALAVFFLRWCARYSALHDYSAGELRTFRDGFDRANLLELRTYVASMPRGADRTKFAQMLSLPVKGFRRRYSRTDNSITEYFHLSSLI